MEQTISARQLGAAFSGCFLGAGYVSGREMWQFFGRFGPVGWLGLCLSIALLGGAGLLLLTMVRRTGRHELSFLMVPWQCPALRHLLALFSVLLLFGVVTIMTAGTGAALHQAFGLPPWLCGLLFALLIAALSLSGLRGMISIFSFAAPALVLCTVGLGAGALLLLPACPPPAFQGGVGWLPSAMAFSAYNMFSAVAILAPLGRQVPPRCTPRGIGLGCTMLFMVAAPILLVLNHYPGAAETEFPMLTVVTAISPGLGIPYLLLLLIAMVVTAFSCFLAGMERLSAGTELHGRERVLRFFAVSLVAWGASLLGFGELISLIYPVFGAVSAVFLTGMAVHFCRVNWGIRMKKQTESDLVAEAVAYMRLHFARPLKLTKVARHVGCSPAYLSRKFQAERSCTFTYCLNQIRVEQSKPLLLNPALTVGDVGYLVGFCEQSYFVKSSFVLLYLHNIT